MRARGAPPNLQIPRGTCPATDDEIREKYLERAIRELNQLTRRSRPASTAHGSVHAGGSAPATRRRTHAAQVRPMPSEIEEGVAFYGRVGSALMKSFKRLGIDPLTVYGTVFVKCPVGDTDLSAPECAACAGGDRHRAPRMVVVMGEDALEELSPARHPARPRDRAAAGRNQRLTPSCDALYVPDIDRSLDEEGAKREFWATYTLGKWYEDFPPYWSGAASGITLRLWPTRLPGYSVADRAAESLELLSALQSAPSVGPAASPCSCRRPPTASLWAADPDAGHEEAEQHPGRPSSRSCARRGSRSRTPRWATWTRSRPSRTNATSASTTS